MPEYTLSFPNKKTITSIPERVIHQIPFFVRWLNFYRDNLSVDQKDPYIFELEDSPELKYRPLKLIIDFLIVNECRYKIDDVGTLRGIRHTALFLGCPHVLEQLILSEKHHISANLFIEAHFPAEFLFKYYPETDNLLIHALETGYSLKELHPLVGTAPLIDAGASLRELFYLGVSLPILRILSSWDHNCYDITPQDYINKNIPLNVDFAYDELTDAGLTLRQIKEAGVDVEVLTRGGVTCSELRDVGYNLDELKQNFNILQLRQAGFSLARLKELSDRMSDLLDPKFACRDLIEAGFTLQDLVLGGVGFDRLNEDNTFSVVQLRTQFPQSTRDDFINRTFPELLEAGFALSELIYPNTNSVQELQSYVSKGATLSHFKTAQINLNLLKKCFSLAEMKRVFSCQELSKQYSFSELRQEFTCLELRQVYPLSKLKKKFSCAELARAQFTAQ